MTQISSKLSVAGTDDPIVHAAFVSRIAGAYLQLSRAEFDLAVSAERARISNNSVGIYAARQPIEIVGEKGYRVWTIGTGGNSAAVAAASHARTVVVRPGLEITLGADGNSVLVGAGAPFGGTGSNGDISIDFAANVIYTKAGGVWSQTNSAIYATGGSGPVVANNLTTTVAGSALDAVQGKSLKDTADALAITVTEKADTTAVSTALAGKADTSTVNTALALKADTATVNTALALKADAAATTTALAGKQATLVSATNIKTINGTSLLGSGDIVVSGGAGVTIANNLTTTVSGSALDAVQGKTLKDTADALATTVAGKADTTTVNTALALKADASATTTSLAGKQATLVSATNIKSIAGTTLLGSGDIGLKTVNGNTLLGSGDIAVAGGSVAGANTQIQFNNAGAAGASSLLTFNTGTNTLGVGNVTGSALAMTVQPIAPTSGENAGTLTLRGQYATAATRGGGAVNITGGNGQTTGEPGHVTITGPNASTIGQGRVTILGGTPSSAAGATVYIGSGPSAAVKSAYAEFIGTGISSPNGDGLILTAGGATFGGLVSIAGGSATTGTGGGFQAAGGLSNSGTGGGGQFTGGIGVTGGSIDVFGGLSVGVGNGGGLNLKGGASAGGGNGGLVSLNGGSGGGEGVNGNGAGISLAGGNSLSDTTGTGGSITAAPGTGITGNGSLTLSSAVDQAIKIDDSGGVTRMKFFTGTPVGRPSTAISAATLVANSGTALNSASTFDGYTLAQVVKALRDLGLLT